MRVGFVMRAIRQTPGNLGAERRQQQASSLSGRPKNEIMKLSVRLIPMILIALIAVALTGCASSGLKPRSAGDEKRVAQDRDPLEKLNRDIFALNLQTDQHVLQPVARTYITVFPKPVRNGINRFFSNLWEPVTIVNDLLQGRFVQAGRDLSRFVINSTLGFVGLNDVAAQLDLPKNREDFGQTLAVWGVPSGPYLVLPFFGPSNVRDAAGLSLRFGRTDAVQAIDAPARTMVAALRVIDSRSSVLGTEALLEVQPDKYLFTRENYRQRRLNLIHNGSPPTSQQDSDDELIDQVLE